MNNCPFPSFATNCPGLLFDFGPGNYSSTFQKAVQMPDIGRTENFSTDPGSKF